MVIKMFALRVLVDQQWSGVCEKGQYSISKTYDLLLSYQPKVDWYQFIRRNKASPKAIFVIWRIAHNRLYTLDRLPKRNS